MAIRGCGMRCDELGDLDSPLAVVEALLDGLGWVPCTWSEGPSSVRRLMNSRQLAVRSASAAGHGN